jgi:hypothetical protein
MEKHVLAANIRVAWPMIFEAELPARSLPFKPKSTSP